jgi:hypothetical protein
VTRQTGRTDRTARTGRNDKTDKKGRAYRARMERQLVTRKTGRSLAISPVLCFEAAKIEHYH